MPLMNYLVDVNAVRILEAILLSLVVILAVLKPHFACRAALFVERRIDRLAAKPLLAACAVGLLALSGTIAVAIFVREPYPSIPDEFSYLLAADTFASGRLTNPPTPFWEHFVSFHVIHQPSYMSKYPPAQGMVLAVGNVLFGKPQAGVWLSATAFAMLTFWMLLAWLPRRWALQGAVLCALNFGFFAYWAQNFWGGLVAACGGALLFGTLPRLASNPRTHHGIVLGLALAILANSRPFEGLLTALGAGVAIIALYLRNRPPAVRPLLLRIATVSLLSLAPFVLFTLNYNRAVTGVFWKLPHGAYEQQYGNCPVFLWQPLQPER